MREGGKDGESEGGREGEGGRDGKREGGREGGGRREGGWRERRKGDQMVPHSAHAAIYTDCTCDNTHTHVMGVTTFE